MSREMCYRCFWPKALCWCHSIQPMETRTKIVLLMSPKEFKQEKAATGRLTHLCLTNSEIHMGVSFDQDKTVQSLLRDPANHCVLLYPGPQALNLSTHSLPPAELGGRRLVVFIIDATWGGARKILRHSACLQRLPRVMFTPTARSRYVIKQQPHENCLSTLEATHELLVALERAGLDRYQLPDQLLGLFARMQEFQIRCAADPTRTGYRRKPYSDPQTRTPPQASTVARRTRFLGEPADAPAVPTDKISDGESS